jgi:rubredoxin
MAEIAHGTASGYEAKGCRCPECRAAMTEARRRVRARRRELAARGGRPVEHGTWAAYTTDGCRCPECRAFKAAYMKRWRGQGRAS